MNERRVRFTETADRHVKDAHAWWLTNRDDQELFASEIEDALQLLALMPGLGTPYDYAPILHLRRFYLPKLTCHLYYTFDDDEVVVRALWGARREHGPQF